MEELELLRSIITRPTIVNYIGIPDAGGYAKQQMAQLFTKLDLAHS